MVPLAWTLLEEILLPVVLEVSLEVVPGSSYPINSTLSSSTFISCFPRNSYPRSLYPSYISANE